MVDASSSTGSLLGGSCCRPWSVSARGSVRGELKNREPLCGNTLVHKQYIEKVYERHSRSLISAKPCLDNLNVPPKTYPFMEKRISKNFHLMEGAKRVQNENLKILRSLEAIHSKPSRLDTGQKGEQKKSSTQEKGRLTKIMDYRRKKAHIKLAAQNAILAKRLLTLKSSYPAEKFRKDRAKQKLILKRLRRDYTRGHLMSSTPSRKWEGGQHGEDAFSYSYASLSSLRQQSAGGEEEKLKGFGGAVEPSRAVTTPLRLSPHAEAPLRLTSTTGKTHGSRGRTESHLGSQAKSSNQSTPTCSRAVLRRSLSTTALPAAVHSELTHPDEAMEMLVQTSKPLEVADRPGDTWICFVRISCKENFDGIFHIYVDHDLAQMCYRTMTVEEARAICGAAVKRKHGGPTHPFAAACSTVAESEDEEREGDAAITENLTKLFKEADKENKGYLTNDDLMGVLEKAHLGLDRTELRLIMAEADENDDCRIDYFEFVPVALNLIHSFRARNKANKSLAESEIRLDEQAICSMYDAEYKRSVASLKQRCKQCDTAGTGHMPRERFKECVADRGLGLTKIEMSLLMNLMPRDVGGDIEYGVVGAALDKVKFTTIRNTMAEAQASDMEHYLMGLCAEAEREGYQQVATEGQGLTGLLRARQMMNVLLNAPLLSLSRLHVMAIMAEAPIKDGMIDYRALVPIAACTIESIFNPESLAMRKQLRSRVDFQPLAVMHGLSPEEISRKLIGMYRGDSEEAAKAIRNPEEFKKVFKELDLGLDPDAINALWIAADLDGDGEISFVELVEFCYTAALFLNREHQYKDIKPKTASKVVTGNQGAAERIDLARKLVKCAKVVQEGGAATLAFTSRQSDKGPEAAAIEEGKPSPASASKPARSYASISYGESVASGACPKGNSIHSAERLCLEVPPDGLWPKSSSGETQEGSPEQLPKVDAAVKHRLLALQMSWDEAEGEYMVVTAREVGGSKEKEKPKQPSEKRMQILVRVPTLAKFDSYVEKTFAEKVLSQVRCIVSADSQLQGIKLAA